MHAIRTEARPVSAEIYFPEHWSATDTRTAVLVIHGGGWRGGLHAHSAPVCRYLAAQGCVCFNLDYRKVHHDLTIADSVSDCRTAMRYIRTHAAEFGIDPNRVAALGESAGGHLAQTLGTLTGFDDPDDDCTISPVPNCIINVNGIELLEGKWLKNIADAEISDREELAHLLSPLEHIQPGQPDTLLLHGTADTVVDYTCSVAFRDAYLSAGNRAELIPVEGAHHAFLILGYTAPVEQTFWAFDQIGQFLDRQGFLCESNS